MDFVMTCFRYKICNALRTRDITLIVIISELHKKFNFLKQNPTLVQKKAIGFVTQMHDIHLKFHRMLHKRNII